MSLCVLVVPLSLDALSSSSSPHAARKIENADTAPVPPTIFRKRLREAASSLNSRTAPFSSDIEASGWVRVPLRGSRGAGCERWRRAALAALLLLLGRRLER